MGRTNHLFSSDGIENNAPTDSSPVVYLLVGMCLLCCCLATEPMSKDGGIHSKAISKASFFPSERGLKEAENYMHNLQLG
jgi:hypothetical protein